MELDSCCPSCGEGLLGVRHEPCDEWEWDARNPPKLVHWRCPKCGARLEEEWGEALRIDPRPDDASEAFDAFGG